MAEPQHLREEIQLHILIAEDDADDQLLISDALKECDKNYLVSLVYNGAQLLDFLLRKGSYKNVTPPDVIILDLHMPVFSGMEVLEKINGNDELKNCCSIYVLSSYDHEDLMQECLDLGASNFYIKPLNFHDLVKIVRTICEEVDSGKKT